MQAKSTPVPKKTGRPYEGGRDPVATLRLPPALRTQIDDWRRKQEDIPSRSEAIRRLVERALKAGK